MPQWYRWLGVYDPYDHDRDDHDRDDHDRDDHDRYNHDRDGLWKSPDVDDINVGTIFNHFFAVFENEDFFKNVKFG